MPWSNPKTWLTDEFVETAEMNQELRDNLNWLHDVQACVVCHSTTQSINNDTPTDLLFDTEVIDTEGLHNTSTNTDRITIVTAGKYYVFANIAYPANGTGYRELYLTANGNIFARQGVPGSASAVQFLNVSGGQVNLAANDILRAGANCSGVALTIAASSNPIDRANKVFGAIRVG